MRYLIKQYNRYDDEIYLLVHRAVAGCNLAAGGTAYIRQTEVKALMKRVADWQIAHPNKENEHNDLDWTHAALYMG